MRTHEQLVVLLPRVDHLALFIDDVEDVLPARLTRRVALRQVVAGGVALGNEVAATAAALDLRQAAALEDEDLSGDSAKIPGRSQV